MADSEAREADLTVRIPDRQGSPMILRTSEEGLYRDALVLFQNGEGEPARIAGEAAVVVERLGRERYAHQEECATAEPPVVDARSIGAIADAIHRELDEAVWHVENMGQAASGTVSDRCAAVYYLSRSFVLLGGMVVDAEIVEPEPRELERRIAAAGHDDSARPAGPTKAERVAFAATAVWNEAQERGVSTPDADALAECVMKALS